MLTNIRTLALLMLLAGASLGVFATTLMADKTPAVQTTLAERSIEERVKAYQSMYSLDALEADAIRTVLIQHRQKLRDLFFELRQKEQDRFVELREATERRIDAIVK